MRVLRIKIVLADIDHGQLEKLREVHYFVKHPLAERAFSDKTYCHATVTQTLRRKSCASGDTGAAANDGIRSKVAGGGVCDMHGTALALAVPSLLAQQFGEHLIWRSAFRQTMSMAAMCPGDVVGPFERFAHTHGNRFFADIKMSQPGHQRARVQLIHLRFELADGNHLPIHAKPEGNFL